MEHDDATDAVDLTSAAVDLPVDYESAVGSGSQPAKRSVSDAGDGEQEVDSKRVALQEHGMQPDAQLQPSVHEAVQFGSGAHGKPAAADAHFVDADMGEEPNERWLQQEKAAVPAGSEIHPMERMLFRSPNVMFGSVSNTVFEDAPDMRAATAERLQTWWSHEVTDDYEVCVVCWGVPGVAGCCLCSDDHVVGWCI